MASLEEADRLHEEHKWAAAIEADQACIDAGLCTKITVRAIVYYRIGHAYLELNPPKEDEAFEWFSKSIRLRFYEDGHHALSCIQRGKLYRDFRGEYGLAIGDFNQAITALIMLAKAKDRAEDAQLNTSPNDLGKAYWHRSLCFRALWHFDLELADLKKAVVIQTDPRAVVTTTNRLNELTQRLIAPYSSYGDDRYGYARDEQPPRSRGDNKLDSKSNNSKDSKDSKSRGGGRGLSASEIEEAELKAALEASLAGTGSGAATPAPTPASSGGDAAVAGGDATKSGAGADAGAKDKDSTAAKPATAGDGKSADVGAADTSKKGSDKEPAGPTVGGDAKRDSGADTKSKSPVLSAAATPAKSTTVKPAASAGSGSGGGSVLQALRPPFSIAPLSVIGVSDYLRGIGKAFEGYIDSFAENYINGAALLKMNDALLTELGVANKFHRLRILGDVELSRQIPPPPPSLPLPLSMSLPGLNLPPFAMPPPLPPLHMQMPPPPPGGFGFGLSGNVGSGVGGGGSGAGSGSGSAPRNNPSAA